MDRDALVLLCFALATAAWWPAWAGLADAVRGLLARLRR
jgi:hypothetical protein